MEAIPTLIMILTCFAWFAIGAFVATGRACSAGALLYWIIGVLGGICICVELI